MKSKSKELIKNWHSVLFTFIEIYLKLVKDSYGTGICLNFSFFSFYPLDLDSDMESDPNRNLLGSGSAL